MRFNMQWGNYLIIKFLSQLLRTSILVCPHEISSFSNVSFDTVPSINGHEKVVYKWLLSRKLVDLF